MGPRRRLSLLLWLVTASVIVELVALRTATRTLVNIPGLERFEAPIRALAEGGRLAYYVATVSLAVTLAVMAFVGLRGRSTRQVAGGTAAVAFLLTAAAGRLDVLSWTVVGWISLVVLVVAGVAGWQGVRSVPVGLFLVGSVAAGWGVLVQTTGQGFSGTQLDLSIWTAEVCLLLAAVTTPLLLDRPPSVPAVLAGGAVTLVVIGAFTAGASTFSILVLWNVGVPGWMPGIAYALACGTLAATIWSATARRQWSTVIGLTWLVAGGMGMISTYQTGLVLAGALLLGGLGDPLLGTSPAASRITTESEHPAEKASVPALL